jgi:exodeoxyribonuclease V alpha subunit
MRGANANAGRDLTTLRGRVASVFFSSPAFSAGRIETAPGELHPFAGKLYVRAGEAVVLHGRWDTHPKYGRQFQAESLEYDTRPTVEGLAQYLANHPGMKGVGPARAGRIARKFGEGFEAALRERPGDVARAARVPVEVIENLRDEWERNALVNATFTRLSAFGLTHHQVATLVGKFGNSVAGLLEENPFLLAREIAGFGFKRVDEIARKIGTDKEHPERLRSGLLHCVHERLDAGDCWIEHGDLVEQANTLLILDTMDSRRRIEEALDELVAGGALASASFSGRFLVALPDILKKETEIGAILKKAAGNNPHFGAEDDPGALAFAAAPGLNERQHEAVVAALASAVSLIAGGAGSGKTYSVSAITKIYRDAGRSVVLAAPTGKAAKRMEQVVGIPAQTLHRLLGYNGRAFQRGADQPVEADLLVVDEAGMIDVVLAWHLLQAVDFRRTAVVLVGDHNQLPPVGPGNILRDLIATRIVPTVVLDQIVRQAGALKENCIAVLRGEVRPTASATTGQPRPWYLCNTFTEAEQVRAFLLDLYANHLRERLGFDLLADVQLLTPTHKGPLGTRDLNVALQRLIQKKLFGVDVDPVPEGRRAKLLPRDKVIQTRNNYELGVMNGAIGSVMSVGPKAGEYTLLFDDKLVEIEPGSGAANDLQLAYALSIHKSQGSEFPCVVAVCHKSHSFMHHRNLLYTAVTRAQRTAILVGDAWGVRNCAQKQEVALRRTFLSILADLEPA